MPSQEFIDSSRQEFEKIYSTSPTVITFAPGRTNIIGEHTDYNDGFVLPMAIEDGTLLLLSPLPSSSSSPRSCVFHSLSFPGEKFEVEDVSHPPPPFTPPSDWKNYVLGVLTLFGQKFPLEKGFFALIASNIPLGGGLSSSASLLVSLTLSLQTFFLSPSSSPPPLSLTEIALLAQKAEREFPLLPCGIMDQFCSSLSKKNNLMLIDCRSLSVKYYEFGAKKAGNDEGEEEVSILIVNSNVKHGLSGSEYPIRVEQCQKAVKFLQTSKIFDLPPNSLRDFSRADLDKACQKYEEVKNARNSSSSSSSLFASKEEEDEFVSLFDETVIKRAKHVIGENERTEKAAEYFSENKWELAGKLMFASHLSLKDDYEVSCEELDIIVEAARKQEGVFGCRMTGGGFGGCCVALVKTSQIEAISAGISREFEEKTGGKHCSILAANPSDGCHVILG